MLGATDEKDQVLSILGLSDTKKSLAEITDGAVRKQKPANKSRPRIGIDARVMFFEGSMERGIGQYTMHHIPALAKMLPDWNLVLLVEEPFPNTYIKKLTEHPNISVELLDRPTKPFDLFHIIDPMSMLPGGDSPYRLFHGPSTSIAYDLIPIVRRSSHYDNWPVFTQISYASRLRQIKESGTVLLSISEHTKRDFERVAEIPANRIVPIMAGLNSAPEACPSDYEIDQTLRKLNITEPFALTVGGLDPHKNFPVTINTIMQVRKTNPIQLVAVGGHSDPYKRTYEEVLVKQGIKDVNFPGFLSRQELTCVYKRATSLIFPSSYEGFGFPVLEAMANGCPVISSNSSSLPEVCGDAAFMFDSENVIGMTQILIRLINEPQLRAETIAKGLRQAQKFTWEKTAQKTIQVWESMINRAPASKSVELL